MVSASSSSSCSEVGIATRAATTASLNTASGLPRQAGGAVCSAPICSAPLQRPSEAAPVRPLPPHASELRVRHRGATEEYAAGWTRVAARCLVGRDRVVDRGEPLGGGEVRLLMLLEGGEQWV